MTGDIFTTGVDDPDSNYNQRKITIHIAMGTGCGVLLAVVGIAVVVTIVLRKSELQHVGLGGCY